MQRLPVRAVFLDRDGTLMEEVDYCRDPGLVCVFDGVREALAELRAAGFVLVVITNQSGIGRGLLSVTEFQAVQAEFLRQIGPGLIEVTYMAPEAPDEPSTRRKPLPGMLLEAAMQYGIDLGASWTIGDKCSDVEAGRAAGTHTILVLTGYGKHQISCNPEFTVPDVGRAVSDVILKVL